MKSEETSLKVDWGRCRVEHDEECNPEVLRLELRIGGRVFNFEVYPHEMSDVDLCNMHDAILAEN